MMRLLFVGLFAVACDSAPSHPAPASTRATTGAASKPPPTTNVRTHVKTRWAAADRLVAVGDLHGDFGAARRVLELAGLLDGQSWSGGKAVLVQTGDVLDRGDGERAIVDLLAKLREQAQKAGGDVIALNGNHELMNAVGDFRYVTPGGFVDFEQIPGSERETPDILRLQRTQRARGAAFFPGGRYAAIFATHPVVAVVGDTVFAHGGVLPKYAEGIEKLNDDVATWLAGGAPEGARVLEDQDGPVWTRRYADDPDAATCKLLDEALQKLAAKRMVIGHTVMKKISPACDDKVWRIDVGMASYYGGKPAALEIKGNTIRVLGGD
jgi:hypothetical protein